MDPKQLNELREIFRKRFKTEDFCIGEEQVERVFRELLGESEPESISTPITQRSQDIVNIIGQAIDQLSPKLENLFNRDDIFYKRIKK